MRKLNDRINLDRAVGAMENVSTREKPMKNSSKKTPWHLRFAPGAILRKSGLAVFAVGLLAFVDPTASLNAATREIHYYISKSGVAKRCYPPMDGKITATPKIKAGRGTIRIKSTVNGYVDSSWPDVNRGQADRSDQGYVWTEYFKIHWDEVIHNPDHDPDDPCSVYLITNPDNLDNEGLHEHGDEYMDGWMEHATPTHGRQTGKEKRLRRNRTSSLVKNGRVGFLRRKRKSQKRSLVA